jgi:hypothetical protein
VTRRVISEYVARFSTGATVRFGTAHVSEIGQNRCKLAKLTQRSRHTAKRQPELTLTSMSSGRA